MKGPQTIQQPSMNLQHLIGVTTQATRKNLKTITSLLFRLRENRVLKKIFGPKRKETMSAWRKPHTAELNDLHSAPNIIFFFLWRCGPARVVAPSFLKLLDHTQRRTTVGMTPLDKWSARRRDLYLTTHNRQIFVTPVGFETTIPAGEQRQTQALDRAATGTAIK
jgi:hypothetical protein